jgi:hypothetical protein
VLPTKANFALAFELENRGIATSTSATTRPVAKLKIEFLIIKII